MSTQLGELLECCVEAIHATDNRLQAGRIGEPDMLVAPERLTGDYGDLELLQEIVGQISRGGDGAGGTLPSKQSAHIGKGIKCSARHRAANA